MVTFQRVVSGKNFLPVSIAAMVLSLQLFNLAAVADTGKVGTLYVALIMTFALSFWIVGMTARTLVFSSAHCWGLLAWALFAAGSLQAVNREWAMLWVGVTGVYLLGFWTMTNFAWLRKEFAERFVDALLFFGLLAALLGLYEYVSYHACGPSTEPLLAALLPPDVNPRAGGPFGQSNLFAAFLLVVLLAYFYRYLHGVRLKCLSWLRFLPVATVASVFFLTYSRGGMVACVLIFGFLTWLVVTGRYLDGEREARKEYLLLLCCLVLGFLLSQADLPGWAGASASGNVASRLVVVETGSNSNTAGRFIFWTSAILMFIDHPWLGVGLDNYRFLMNGYGPRSHALLGFVEYEAMMPTFWAHNEYLQLLCEGGIFLFAVVLFLLLKYLRSFWRRIVKEKQNVPPLFIYSHLFLLPFLLQSFFEWPLRHPALLLLFVVLAGILAAQYPMQTINMSLPLRKVTVILLATGMLGVFAAFSCERQIVDFKHRWLTQPLESTLDDFIVLAEHPYSSYRILRNTVPRYTNAALSHKDDLLVRTVLPYAERLARLEGTAGQWYDLARLYLRANRLEDARSAIRQAFELKPTDTVIFDFLHYLNVLKASRDTGRPVEDFLPKWAKPLNLNFPELKNE